LYEVEFDSGETEAYHANIIAESIFARVDDDGYTTFMLKEIIDHKKDATALSMEDTYYTHNIYNEQFVQSGQYYSLGQKLDKVLMA
jgi:hypothetical protein